MDCHAEDEANGGGGLLEPAEKGSNANGGGGLLAPKIITARLPRFEFGRLPYTVLLEMATYRLSGRASRAGRDESIVQEGNIQERLIKSTDLSC